MREEGKMERAVKQCSGGEAAGGSLGLLGGGCAVPRAEARSSFPSMIRYCLHRNGINLPSFILVFINSKREGNLVIKNFHILPRHHTSNKFFPDESQGVEL